MSLLDSALALAAKGFYIFPITAGKKLPPIQDWQAKATRDPAVILEWWKPGNKPNIGIFTGKFHPEGALLVIDVDNKGEKHGDEQLVRLEFDGCEFPETYTQHTPSGGRHLVYLVSHAVRQGVDVLSPGLDIRSHGGYIVGAGSVVSSGEYTANDSPIVLAPDWLVQRCGAIREKSGLGSPAPSVDAGRARDRAYRYLIDEAPVAVEGQGGDQTTYKVAARCKDFGVTCLEAVTLALVYWNPRCTPPWPHEMMAEKFRNAFKYGQSPAGVASPEADFAPVPFTNHEQPQKVNSECKDSAPSTNPIYQLNDEFAFVMAGGGAHILWETTDTFDQACLYHLDVTSFHQKLAPRKMIVGNKEQAVSKLWFEWEGRRSYDGIAFSPEKPISPRFYNLWRGFSVKPADPGEVDLSVSMFFDHALINVCNGDRALFRWLVGYFAHLIQKPWEKPLVALVFQGEKGVGKSALVERVGALLGPHFLMTAERRYLTGNFNGHLENCLLFGLEEAFWSGDKQAEGIVKNLITGQKHLIEHKGYEPYTVENRTRVVILGNEDWLVPASHDERRFAAFHVGTGRKQDTAFFRDMRVGMEEGGYAVLLRFLMDYDLTGIDVNEAPRTRALASQKEHTLEPIHQWWLDCLSQGALVGSGIAEWPESVGCSVFRGACSRYLRDRQIRSWEPSERVFGVRIRRCSPGLGRVYVRQDKERLWTYRLPSLADARKEWDSFIGQGRTWESVDELPKV
jgi:hypothetical protein